MYHEETEKKIKSLRPSTWLPKMRYISIERIIVPVENGQWIVGWSGYCRELQRFNQMGVCHLRYEYELENQEECVTHKSTDIIEMSEDNIFARPKP